MFLKIPATALHETIVEKYNRFIVFFAEYKLHGFDLIKKSPQMFRSESENLI